jgi:hypothetical protein
MNIKYEQKLIFIYFEKGRVGHKNSNGIQESLLKYTPVALT